jgi:hypothetical protein
MAPRRSENRTIFGFRFEPALCRRLPLFVAPKGQEKGNVSGRPLRGLRSCIGEGQVVVVPDEQRIERVALTVAAEHELLTQIQPELCDARRP